MYCGKCGNDLSKIKAGARFCPGCGAPITAAQAPEAASAASPNAYAAPKVTPTASQHKEATSGAMPADFQNAHIMPEVVSPDFKNANSASAMGTAEPAYNQYGAPHQINPIPPVQAAPPRKSSKGLAIALTAIISAVVLACVAIFIWPLNILGIFGGKTADVKKNPLGAAYGGMAAIATDKGGFDFSITGTDGESMSFKMALGRDLRDSAMDITMMDDGDTVSRVIMANDSLAVCEGDGIYEAGNYQGITDLSSGLTSALKDSIGLDIDFNAIVKDGKFNDEWSKEYYEKLSGLLALAGGASAVAPEDTEEVLAALGSMQYSENIYVVTEDFFYKECANPDITSTFITDSQISTGGGLTTNTFTLSAKGLLDAYTNYLGKLADDDKYLKKNGLTSEEIRSVQGILEVLVSDAGDDVTIEMSVTTKGKRLVSIGFTAYGETVTITFGETGGSSINKAEIQSILAGANLYNIEDLLGDFPIGSLFGGSGYDYYDDYTYEDYSDGDYVHGE